MSNVLNDLGLNPSLPERRTTSDHIAEAIRQAIFNGQLPDGAELNQVALAEHFGVSRVPVREAIRQLHAEGLISAEAHRRAVVRGLSLERIIEIHELRGLIEGYLVEKAVPLITPAELEALKEIDREMAEVDDHERWLELNAEFHSRLYEPSGQITAMELAAQLRARGERYLKIWSGGQGMDRAREAGKEHAKILRCVQKGDAEGARAELQRHIAHTKERVVELYGSQVAAAAAAAGAGLP